MKYARPPFMAPGTAVEKTRSMFSSAEFETPVFDGPITRRENFKRAAARNRPLWIPNSQTDIQSIMTRTLVTGDVYGRQIGADFAKGATENYVFTDWFNTSWTWVCSAGGAMLTPGTMLCGDITEWEKIVEFPDLKEWDFETYAAHFNKNVYKPDKVLHIGMGQGLTERLISVMGGYTDGLVAMALEPEAVSAFLDRFAEHFIEWFDLLLSLYPNLDMITYHDDWGTEKDTFFSPNMMEDLVFRPTKRIVDHVRSKHVLFEFHSCGNITRFMPYFLELGADFLQLQRRAVDIPLLKAKYGDRIGFNTGIEGFDFTRAYGKDELASLVRNSVDLYGERGGVYFTIFGSGPESVWDQVSELYAYSREYYEQFECAPRSNSDGAKFEDLASR
jgi:hypothetical protein